MMHPPFEILFLSLTLTSLTACASAPRPQVYELANMRETNLIPKTSPAGLVRAFKRFCLQGRDPLAEDYVEANPSGRFRQYVVDDTRPLITKTADNRFCAVSAASRTGQTARAEAFVAEAFPEAQPINAQSVSRNTEAAWRSHGAIIATQRHGAPSSPAIYSLSITRSERPAQ